MGAYLALAVEGIEKLCCHHAVYDWNITMVKLNRLEFINACLLFEANHKCSALCLIHDKCLLTLFDHLYSNQFSKRFLVQLLGWRIESLY